MIPAGDSVVGRKLGEQQRQEKSVSDRANRMWGSRSGKDLGSFQA